MSNFLAKAPFLRLLLPLLGGILVQYYFHLNYWITIAALILGCCCMLSATFIHPVKQYSYRWMLGLGIYLSFFAIGIISTSIKQNKAGYEFSSKEQSYYGVIINIPQEKSKSYACHIKLPLVDKKILCYRQKGVRSKDLKVGDKICFKTKIERFKYYGDPNTFDYPSYMYNQGFSGTTYLYSDDWEGTGEKEHSLSTLSLTYRQKILDFFKSLNLNNTQYSVISALTLGYKNDLPEDIKQSFRATGTAHVLAVSGMHVGIIYGVILSFFSIFSKRARYKVIPQALTIALLWSYALVTGFSPSVIRACIMLSIFCIAGVIGRRGFTYNNIAIAAFLILLLNPFTLFDIGFQLSFCAVIFICAFQPVFSKILFIKNKYARKVWELFTLSFAAQLGTFPVCLYYFGTFPSYFFITNLLIVPVIAFVIYATLTLSLISFSRLILPDVFVDIIANIPVFILKVLIKYMTIVIQFFEQLPYSLIDGLRVSLTIVLLLFAITACLFLYLKYRNAKSIILALSFIFTIVIINIIPPQDSISIYKKDEKTIVAWNSGHYKELIDSISKYKYIRIKDKKFLTISSDYRVENPTKEKIDIDYLHIVKNDSISLYSLTQRFRMKRIILDSSLSNSKRKKLIKECKKLNLPYYDVSEKGLFRIFF